MKKNLFSIIALVVLLTSSPLASTNEVPIDNYAEKTSQVETSINDNYSIIKNVKANIIPEKYSKKIGTPKLIFVGGGRSVQVTCPKGTTFIARDSKGNIILKRKFKKSKMLKLIQFPEKMNNKKVYMYTKSGNKRGKIIKTRLHFVPHIE